MAEAGATSVLAEVAVEAVWHCDFTKTEIFDDSGRMIQAAIENTND